jgi:hypothetical protein
MMVYTPITLLDSKAPTRSDRNRGVSSNASAEYKSRKRRRAQAKMTWNSVCVTTLSLLGNEPQILVIYRSKFARRTGKRSSMAD